MSNQKKAKIGVFHILKSVVDAKTAPLHYVVETGRRAQAEYPVMCEHIAALHQVISNCRTFDPNERREAEQDLEDKEVQLTGIQNRIERAQSAKNVLSDACKFNSIYTEVCNAHNNAAYIKELKGIAEELEEKMCVLEDKIWACQINMDPTSRAPYIVAQAQADADEYAAQYQDLETRLQAARNKIRQLQR